MGRRGVYDTEGELLGYVEGSFVYTLDDEQIGEIKGSEIVDLNDESMWMIKGDGLYTKAGAPVGYLGSERSEERAPWE